MRRPDSYASLQPTHSTIVSIINPSYRSLPATSKHTALPRSHLPHQPNPHSGVRGILRAPSPAGSFLGGFRTPATGVCRAAVAGRHPKPSTKRKWLLLHSINASGWASRCRRSPRAWLTPSPGVGPINAALSELEQRLRSISHPRPRYARCPGHLQVGRPCQRRNSPFP